MTNKVIVKNSTVAGKRPAAGSGTPGELFVNVADQVIGTFDAAGAPVELSVGAITEFDPAVAYAKDKLVTRNGHIYRSIVSTPAKPWAATDWDDITIRYDAVQAWQAATLYPKDSLVTNGGKIYRATAAAPAAIAFDATKWTLIADAAQTFTAGSIPFADTGGALTEDNAALFWDKTNKRLGVGTKTPGAELDVVVSGKRAFAVNPEDYTSVVIGRRKADNISNLVFDTGAANTPCIEATGEGFQFRTQNVARYGLQGSGIHVWTYSAAGTEGMRFTQTGQLGIGVVPTATDPLLTVNSDAKINGMTVGKGANSILGNVALGDNALASITTGASNTAIGYISQRNNQTGSFNCGFGQGTLLSNVSGSRNLAFGMNSLSSLQSGNFNTCIGEGAGQSITTGSGNVIIGQAPGEAAMTNTVIIADGAGGEKVRWTDTGAMQIGQTAEPTGIAGKLHLWFNGTNLMMKVGTGAATIVK